MSRLFFAQSAFRGALREAAGQPKLSSRSFSSLPSLRPTILCARVPNVFRPGALPTATAFAPPSAVEEVVSELTPKTSVTAHPALCSLQIRFAPHNSMAGASRLIRMRRHGFLSRVKTRKGRALLKRRRAKGRKRLGAY